jgi:ribose-phosphate pyrophosphokinase
VKIFNINLGDNQSYEKFRYPAGELQVRLKEPARQEISQAELVTVTARIKTAEDAIETCLLCSAVRGESPALGDAGGASVDQGAHGAHMGAERDLGKQVLILPYLPYARADRRFVGGDCFGLEVFANILNGLDVRVMTVDAHSAKSHSLIKGLLDVAPKSLIEKVIGHILRDNSSRRLTLLFPDDGARNRYSLMAPEFDLDILHCTKVRDKATGKLSHFSVPAKEEFKTSDVLLIDDICDGGGTFIGIADSLKDYGLKLSLYVTHGIFSKGLEVLSKHFETIYTTDSFERNVSSPQLIVYPTAQLFEEFLLSQKQEKVCRA